MAIEVVFHSAGLRFAAVRSIREVPIPPWPSDPLGDDLAGRTGLWVEVRNAQGATVYRRILHDAGGEIEGATEDGRILRVTGKERAPLHVIIPHVPDGRVILLTSSDGNTATATIEAALPRII